MLLNSHFQRPESLPDMKAEHQITPLSPAISEAPPLDSWPDLVREGIFSVMFRMTTWKIFSI